MIGKLSRILTLQELTMTPDGGGGYAEIWQNVAQDPLLHAAIEGISGGKAHEARQAVATARCRILFRYRSDVNPGMRFTEGAFCYDILSVSDADGKKAFLEAVAEKRNL